MDIKDIEKYKESFTKEQSLFLKLLKKHYPSCLSINRLNNILTNITNTIDNELILAPERELILDRLLKLSPKKNRSFFRII